MYAWQLSLYCTAYLAATSNSITMPTPPHAQLERLLVCVSGWLTHVFSSFLLPSSFKSPSQVANVARPGPTAG